MKTSDEISLLKLLWLKGSLGNGALVTTDGRVVSVENCGVFEPSTGMVNGVRLVVAGERSQGSVYFIGSREADVCGFDVVLAVTTDDNRVCCYENGELVPTAVVTIAEDTVERFKHLVESAATAGCAPEVEAMNSVERVSFLTSLLLERLERKYTELTDIHNAGERDWNHTLFVMVFRAMAGNRNKESFTRLANIVPYTVIAQERDSIFRVEALLLGSAGLLYGYDDDDYIARLNDEFAHLRRKYSIEPMKAAEWDRGGFPGGSPLIRIAELASFFTNREFILGKILECGDSDDLYKIFCTSASDYWATHYNPGRSSARTTKSIGKDKAESLGINLVVPFMFAYGKSISDERIQSRALQLLESIACEKNSITARWIDRGTPLHNAFDSQAIIELNNEYCLSHRCTLCRIGKRILT